MKEKVFALINAIKNTRYFIKVICFAVVCVAALGFSLVMSGTTVAYNVKYGDAIIGQVTSREVFNEARAKAESMVVGADAGDYFGQPRFVPTLTLSERLETADIIAQRIIDNTDGIAGSAALIINGETVAYSGTSSEIENILSARLTDYIIENVDSDSEFVDNVVISNVYCPVSIYTPSEQIGEIASTLSVRTTAQHKTDVTLTYKTVTNRRSDRLVGYYSVDKKGVNGLMQKVEQVVYIDGVEVERQTLSDSVVSEPVNEVVSVGIGSTSSISANKGASFGMTYPVERSGRYWYISTYFMESGRHKGIDIAIAGGTPIYAILNGTVTEAGYRGDYGYYLTIQHTNGFSARYAHCSKLMAKVGDKVVNGQTIALVGSTGQSTGNHLHFELRLNGSLVDPLSYIK